MSKKKAREFWLVLFTNCIGEKTGHVYYSKKAAGYFNYLEKDVVRVKVREISSGKK